jgi:hypothetical protein
LANRIKEHDHRNKSNNGSRHLFAKVGCF